MLIFDQFEEVLTLAPRAVDEKRDFFGAVGQALEEEKYWTLFIVREDYLAAFAPYRDRTTVGALVPMLDPKLAVDELLNTSRMPWSFSSIASMPGIILRQ